MTRPTRRQLERAIRYIRESDAGHYRDDSQANARMLLAEYDYQMDLLRRAVWSNERLRAHVQRLLAGLSTSNIDEAMEESRVICAKIREAIGGTHEHSN